MILLTSFATTRVINISPWRTQMKDNVYSAWQWRLYIPSEWGLKHFTTYEYSLKATIDHHRCSMHCGYYIFGAFCWKRPFYCNNDRPIVCDMNHTRDFSTTYIIICKLLVERNYNQDAEDGKYLLPWYQHISSISLNTSRGIGTATCQLDNVFPLDDLWFGSDT